MSIRSFSKFLITEEAKSSLQEKSEKSGVSVLVLEEVFNRGIDAWSEDTGKTPEQYAFNRVNSFISGGMATKMDNDLHELSSQTLTNYSIKAAADKHKHTRKLHVDAENSRDATKAYVRMKQRHFGIKMANRKIATKSMPVGTHESNVVDNSKEELIERSVAIDPVKYVTVNRRETKSSKVSKRHNQREKGMYHTTRTQLVVNKGFTQSGRAHLTNRQGQRLTDKITDDQRKKITGLRQALRKSKHLGESDKYIAARKIIHDAHHESSRQLAGMERDPELRRIDLHRAKKHAHASRVLDILSSKQKKK